MVPAPARPRIEVFHTGPLVGPFSSTQRDDAGLQTCPKTSRAGANRRRNTVLLGGRVIWQLHAMCRPRYSATARYVLAALFSNRTLLAGRVIWQPRTSYQLRATVTFP
ncbi:hypothetical protein ACU19_06120 [Actinobaculum suis]|nr:hypothetical protein ACU19_06120 [Actinobaculum suis]